MCRRKTITESAPGLRRIAASALSVLLLAASAAPAQEPAAAAPAQAAAEPSAPACCTIPADTLIEVELQQEIKSGRNRTGEMFPVLVSAPVVIDGHEVVPAGAASMGEVVHSAPHRLVSHAPGELILAMRYVEAGGVRIPLHGLQLSESGREGNMYFISAGGSFSFAQGMGGNVTVPAGTRLLAKVRGNVVVPPR